MNEIKDLPKSIPETSHTFQCDIAGILTNQRFLGEFVCRIPTLKDQCLIARHEAALNGEFSAFMDPGVLKVNKMISYLKYTLVDVPLFWRNSEMGYALRDSNVIEFVYDEVLAFEKKWLEQIWGKDESVDEQKA